MVSQFLLNGLIAGSAYALIALSFALIYISTQFFHFAHGAVFAWGAYFGYTCYMLFKFPLWITMPLAIAASAGLGIALEAGIYCPLRRRGATGLVLLLASLGLYVGLQNLISLLFGDETKSLRGGEVTKGIAIFGAHITPIQLWLIFTSVAFFTLIWAVLKFTKFGKALRAISSDAELALVHGIDADRVILGAFALGSALARLAALLIAQDVDMTPTMGLNALMMGIVAMIVGGIGSVPGTWLGGMLLGLAQHLGVWKIGSQWQDAIAFAILLLFLLLRPQGFLGQRLRKVEV
ncbi:branched-chain amino acid ABC transporter permease [Candidatus Poribacteria bacterium]|nr:branched-chain amino acid ABC transporter permease [Candidatus Poribacteria bacterium]